MEDRLLKHSGAAVLVVPLVAVGYQTF